MVKDLLREAELARAIEFPPGAEELALASSWVYAQVLFALWDSGFYEFVRERPRFTRAEAEAALGLCPEVFASTVFYLIGRGVLRPVGEDALELTEKGTRVHNTLARGLINLYVGGYAGLLARLGPLLRGEIEPDDPALARSVRHAAAGTEDMTCVRLAPRLIELLTDLGVRHVLDLGCGTGGFLVQWARLTAGDGLGVDVSEEALAEARANAAAFGVAGRLGFVRAEVGAGPLPLGADEAARVEALTAMFLLHEFGRDGDEGVVRALQGLAAQFPGRVLIAAEMPPVDVVALRGRQPPALDAIDYHFIHPLSGQGPPRPRESWERLFAAAGVTLTRIVRPWGSPVLVYVARMEPA